MNNFEVVIGIEIHIELNTKTKMFSPAPVNFSAAPNTSVSHIDLAYPGYLPTVNKEVVRRGIKMAKALNMQIDDVLHFDRKHYMYFDLPKGFQVTQNDRPIGSNGYLPVFIDRVEKKIEIERIHLEEDTAKSTHNDEFVFLDYNRAGVPLIEIVSRPIMRDAKEAVKYIEGIRELVIMLGISDAKMEEGSLRADVNISLRPYGQEELGTKVEIKNLNSLSNVERGIQAEIAHQTKALLSGKEILQATKRFDEDKKDTITMRVKSSATDYRYLPEPNIPNIKLSKEFIDSVEVGDLPWNVRKELSNAGIDSKYVDQLISDTSKLKFFKSINFKDLEKLSKIFFAEIVSLANNQNIQVTDLGINPDELVVVLNKLELGEISGAHVKKIIPLLQGGKKTTKEIIQEHGFKQLSDEKEITKLIEEIISENSDFVENNKERPERVFKFILGILMKKTRGQVNPIMASSILNNIIEV